MLLLLLLAYAFQAALSTPCREGWGLSACEVGMRKAGKGDEGEKGKGREGEGEEKGEGNGKGRGAFISSSAAAFCSSTWLRHVKHRFADMAS